MKEIKCPNCGHTIQLDDSLLADILSQVRNQEFEEELNARVKAALDNEKNVAKLTLLEEVSKREQKIQELLVELKHQNELKKSELEALDQSHKLNLQTELANKNIIIDELTLKANGENDRIKNAVMEAIMSKEQLIAEQQLKLNSLEAEIKSQNDKQVLKEKQLKENYENVLKMKDEEIERYKDFKLRLSTKMIGESLEQYIFNQFESLRATAFQNAYFAKDNNVIDGGKGDFIFRDFTPDGVEYISIMFELKNEADETSTKHKNEAFFDKLDKDRNNHNCEYAVLVSMLEPENEYYNQGIVDVSYRANHPKMYAIRPQNFIAMITLLRNAALKNAEIRNELELAKKQNVDVTDFEDKLEAFKESFGKNVVTATSKFENAIEEIDKTISHLTKVRDDLVSTSKNLNMADKKLEDITIKKLTRNNPTMKEKFAELEEKNNGK